MPLRGGHYIRASACRGHLGDVTVAGGGPLPSTAGMGAPGVCAAIPCLTAGTSEPQNQHLGPPRGQGPWDTAPGEQEPPLTAA